MFRASCFFFPLKLGLIIPSPPGWSLESSRGWGESPIQFGFCFSMPSDLWAGFSDMVGTSSWTVLASSAHSLDLVTFVPHFVSMMPACSSWPSLLPWIPPCSPYILGAFSVFFYGIFFFFLFLLTGYLQGFILLFLGVSSPWPTLLPSLCEGLLFPCQVDGLLSAECSTHSKWNLPTHLFSNCLFLCQCVQSPIFSKPLIFETS